MAIETYKECEIEFDSNCGFIWSHPNYDGPPDEDDFKSLIYFGHASDMKEVYCQIDELMAEMEAEKNNVTQ